MLRFRVLAIAGCLLAFGSVQAQDAELKAVLKKAIEAHGGAKSLDQFKAVNSKFKGTIQLMGASRAITGETWFQKPDKLKHVNNIDFNGKDIEVITVYDGKKLWVRNSAVNMTFDIDDEKILTSVREQLQTEGASSLSAFLKAPYELNAVGEVKVKDKDALGIRISKKGQPDITFFFDKKTHLIVKTEMRTYDAEAKQEITQEKFMIGYRDKDGMKVPERLEIQKDGKAFMAIEIQSSQPLEKIDEAMFAKP